MVNRSSFAFLSDVLCETHCMMLLGKQYLIVLQVVVVIMSIGFVIFVASLHIIGKVSLHITFMLPCSFLQSSDLFKNGSGKVDMIPRTATASLQHPCKTENPSYTIMLALKVFVWSAD